MTAATTTMWRPGRLRRFGDRMLTKQLPKGKAPGFMRLLTVIGRTSGLPRSTPVVPVQDGDLTWVVAAFGDVSWVRNLRAAGRLTLQRGEDQVAYSARELPPAEAVPVLRAYLSMPSRLFVRREFDINRHSSDAAIEAEAPRHPVFALTPLT